MIRSISLILCLYILNNVNSIPLSQDEMNNNDLKQVQFMERVTPLSHVIGQVGGLDTNSRGNLVVFHRGSRKWSWDSFSGDNFNKDKYGPIKENVLTVLNVDKSKELKSWGGNKFYMPHGLTIDHDKNIWLTDVALHQVFKYNFGQSEEPLLVLGTKFEKGSDHEHFCKPTSVAVSQIKNEIFIADGYCNRRIAHFDENGKFIKEFKDEKQPMTVVHSIALLEEKNLICTVSREEGRIICFDIDSGEKKFDVRNENMRTVYAIEYDPFNQVIHAATGTNNNIPSYGLSFDASWENFGKLIQKWTAGDEDLGDSHDIALSPDAKRIFIGQLNGELDEFSFE